jgi:hypothetical protein
VNLGGSVMDGTIAPEREYSFEWDGPWESATAELPDGWSMEMFLPWSMMAMPEQGGDGKNTSDSRQHTQPPGTWNDDDTCLKL